MTDVDAPSDGLPDLGELLDLIERLDGDNERLRLRVLDFMEWMEEAVTAQVAAERELDGCRRHAAGLAVELDAIRGSRSWRLARAASTGWAAVTRPFRRSTA